jgi:hypothetical protein
MNQTLLIGVFTATLLCRLGCAQTPAEQPLIKEALPPGKLIVTSMPAFAQWSIDFTYRPEAKPGQAVSGNMRPVHVLVTKTGDITHEEKTFENGMYGEMWSNHNIAVQRLPNSLVLEAGFGNGGAANAFPDFDWISKESYVGTQEHNHIKCMVFKQPKYGIENGFLGIATAYVGFTSRYPVGYEMNDESRAYAILPPPTVQLAIPDNFLTAGKAMIVKLQRATPHLAPP